MTLDGKGSHAPVKPKPNAVEDTSSENNTYRTEDADQDTIQGLAPVISPDSMSTTRKGGLKNNEAVNMSSSPKETTNVSSTDKQLPRSTPRTSRDSETRLDMTQQATQEQENESTQLLSATKGGLRDLSKKRIRNQQSPSERNPEPPQNLTQNVDEEKNSDIWKRYDLSATKLTTAREMAELEAVENQIWKRKKFVPYTGINPFQPSGL